ncbi:MAG: DUF4474 domain-containing protein, partial [Elusimicrobiota bacterium]|nr:DUF4474 domain-containing protein [Elusimicrobiota bacterium]
LYNEKGKVVRSNYKTIINNHLKDDDNFFIYNQLAYERAETVTGAKPAPLSNSQSYIMTLNSDKTDWQPSTKLAFAVVLAGFYYDPKQDIIYSTLNNLQRSLGYCSLYDKNAYLMSSIIECEPIYFSYNGFEWMIELWKGQYGLETGCEVGLYKRPQDQPISLIEQLVTGKIYSCVGDKDLITMSFALIKDGNAILQRGPQQHWWLTGFKWGEFSKPEELKVKYTLGFNDDAMPKAFIEGLKKLHYSYEINGNSASFVFDRPFSAQPLISDKIKNICQKDNQKICDAYNNLKKEFKIKTNDPNEIDERLIKNASVENKAIHEHIIAHFKNKQSFVEDILKHSLSGLPIDSVNAKTLRLNSER